MNHILIETFSKLIDFHKTKGSNSFKIRSFQKTLEILKTIDFNIEDAQELATIKGIGKGSVDRINEILNTGGLSEIKNDSSDDIKQLMRIHGIGPKHASKLYTSGITLEKLQNDLDLAKKYLHHHQLIGLRYLEDIEQRIPYAEIVHINTRLKTLIKEIHPELQFEICGSFRRKKETSGDVDMLMYYNRCSGAKPTLEDIVSHLTTKGFLLDHLTELGKTKYMGVCKLFTTPRRIDIRLIPKKQLPFALLYFTGSGTLNKHMRQKAIEKGLKLNEYSMIDKETNKSIILKSEKEIFEYLDMDYLEPHERDL